MAPEGFTGTEPGTVTAIFLPATMQAMVDVPYAGIYQMFVLLKPGVAMADAPIAYNARLPAFRPRI